MLIRSPTGLLELDLEEDIGETGGIETDAIVRDWLYEAGPSGITVDDLCTHMLIPEHVAAERLQCFLERGDATFQENVYYRID